MCIITMLAVAGVFKAWQRSVGFSWCRVALVFDSGDTSCGVVPQAVDHVARVLSVVRLYTVGHR